MSALPAVVAIGGSDPSCGAGVQADLRTLDAFGVVPATVVTALTVQDGARVAAVRPVASDLVISQLDTLVAGLPVSAVKCGMLARAATVRAVAAALDPLGLPLVVDPVTHASGGEALGVDAVGAAIVRHLLPMTTVLTCNLDEASALTGRRVGSLAAAERAARELGDLGPRAVVVKGGHLPGEPVDVLWDGERLRRWTGSRLRGAGGDAMHGTGCAFASALAAGLAFGRTTARSLTDARKHVRALIAASIRMPSRARVRAPRGRSR